MLDEAGLDVATIVAIITSIGAIIGAVIAFINTVRSAKANGKNMQITKEGIVEGFKMAILPQNINIDVTTKMAEYLSGIKGQLAGVLAAELQPWKEATAIMIKILANTAAANKLTQEEKDKLEQIYNYISGVSTDVTV